jgi:anti-sigma-K factor RskA
MRLLAGRDQADRSPAPAPELVDALRAAYAAPTEDAYWATLESRIMTRLRQADGPVEWWHVLAEWRPARVAGLVAAGLMLSLAGVSLWKERQVDSEMRKLAAGAAYWTVFDVEGEDVSIAFTVPTGRRGGREAADRHLFNVEP